MKLKAIKSLWSGAKQLKQSIKSYRTTSSAQTLALKRQEAKNYVETIPDETWDKLSNAIFEQKGDSKSILLDKLHKYKNLFDKNGIKMPDDVLQAYNRLEHKATVFTDRMTKAKAKGKTPENYWNFGDKFRANNKEELEKLYSFYRQQLKSTVQKSHDMVFSGKPYDHKTHEELTILIDKLGKNHPDFGYIDSSDLYNPKIGEVANNIITKGQTFYHGTKHQRAITKNGFQLIPKKTQNVTGARELGEGVYLTLDKNVASRFSGILGGILPVKIDTKKVAVVNNAQVSSITSNITKELGEQEPAALELIIKKLFQRNGYNTAYAREALGNDHKLIDEIAGGKESQLVVFEPKVITLLKNSLKERIDNKILQIKIAFEKNVKITKLILKEIAETNKNINGFTAKTTPLDNAGETVEKFKGFS